MNFTYEGIEVTYNEAKDQWEFELRGRSRSAPSPAKAKEFIDKEPSPMKAKPFPRFNAYLFRDGQMDSIVEVTSIAQRAEGRDGEFGYSEFWIQSQKTPGHSRERSKVRQYLLRAITPENDAIIAKMTALREQLSSLRAQHTELGKTVTMIRIPEGF